MAIVVLVLWLCTAGAGFSLLVTSNLGRTLPAEPAPVPAGTATGTGRPGTARRRDRFETPSLAAARSAPMVPGLRSLLEFAHPACGLIGLGFWLAFTLVHYRLLGWIAVGLVAVTACAGLAWLAASTRFTASTRAPRDKPLFPGRLVALHGAAAAVTVTLAALAAFAVIT
jgi:hypothetical protein